MPPGLLWLPLQRHLPDLDVVEKWAMKGYPFYSVFLFSLSCIVCLRCRRRSCVSLVSRRFEALFRAATSLRQLSKVLWTVTPLRRMPVPEPVPEPVLVSSRRRPWGATLSCGAPGYDTINPIRRRQKQPAATNLPSPHAPPCLIHPFRWTVGAPLFPSWCLARRPPDTRAPMPWL